MPLTRAWKVSEGFPQEVPPNRVWVELSEAPVACSVAVVSLAVVQPGL